MLNGDEESIRAYEQMNMVANNALLGKPATKPNGEPWDALSLDSTEAIIRRIELRERTIKRIENGS